MAEKATALSIILRTVDQATAGIRAVNARIKEITKPIRDFKESLGDLRKNSGIDEVAAGFRGVGDAIGSLLAKVAMIGGIVGLAIGGVFHLVKEFDDLGDMAERLGVSVDFLAAMRYAAEKAGAPVESLDEGLQSFEVNLGKARAGTGRMAAFLTKAYPQWLTQLKATKSNEEAFLFLADAMSKLKDPAKRAALAQATVGDAALAPLLAKGSAGVKELADRYKELSGGGMADAAEAAGQVDDSLHDLHAATDGVKAALVSGLAPALKIVVDQLRDWLRGHREDLAIWAASLGQKLPAAFNAVVAAIGSAVDTLKPFIDRIGGAKGVGIALAAFMVGPLVAAFATLGVAILSTPVGWVIAGLAGITAAASYLSEGCRVLVPAILAIGAVFAGLPLVAIPMAFITAATLIVKYWSPIGTFFKMLWDGITAIFSAAWDVIKAIVDKVIGAARKVKEVGQDVKGFVTGESAEKLSDQRSKALGEDRGDRLYDEHLREMAAKKAQAAAAAQAQLAGANSGMPGQAAITVDFKNMPKGTRVTTDPQSTADVDLNLGYNLMALVP